MHEQLTTVSGRDGLRYLPFDIDTNTTELIFADRTMVTLAGFWIGMHHTEGGQRQIRRIRTKLRSGVTEGFTYVGGERVAWQVAK